MAGAPPTSFICNTPLPRALTAFTTDSNPLLGGLPIGKQLAPRIVTSFEKAGVVLRPITATDSALTARIVAFIVILTSLMKFMLLKIETN
jgi:hypothetical protein